MTSKESLFAILNAVGGLMFLAVLVTVCLAMAAAPVASMRQTVTYYRNTEHQSRFVHSDAVDASPCACLRKSFGLLPAVFFSSCSPTPGEGLSPKEKS